MVTVTVGSEDDRRDFIVHKALLCAASAYFTAALDGSFAEAQQGVLHLKDHCPMAFEVLYQYIYTGQTQPSVFYTKFGVKSDTLWLRTFRLADAIMIEDLKGIAYRCLREYLGSWVPTPPSQTFIDELFSHGFPEAGLQNYVVAHTAYWVNNEKMDSKVGWEDWHSLVEKNMAYGAAVAAQLTKVVSKSYTGNRCHPSEDKVYDPEVLFPQQILETSHTNPPTGGAGESTSTE